MANAVILMGNIGSMEDLKHIPSGKAVLKFTLATNKRIKGEDKTTWHRCIVWDKTAEIIAQHFSKGSKIYVQGEIDNGSYDDKDGRKVYTSEIIVREFDFCGSKADNQGQQTNNQSSQGSWGANNGNQNQSAVQQNQQGQSGNYNQSQNNNQNQNQNQHPQGCNCEACSIPF